MARVNHTLTLSEFLAHTGAFLHAFDMGRRVVEVGRPQLLAFERAEQAYPLPFLRSAWLGLLFRYSEAAEHATGEHIWFLKLPLDEQGLIQQAARDDVLRRIGETLARPAPDDAASALDDNPYGFTPRADRMAVFHAKASRLRNQAPSPFFGHAADYFQGKTGFEQWQFVGLQGIADVVVRRDQRHHGISLRRSLLDAVPRLPATPYSALCTCLEHERIDAELGRSLAARLHRDLAAGSPETVAAGLRALSCCEAGTVLRDSLSLALDKPPGRHVEVLAAIAGRAWEVLENPDIRHRFLRNLALCEAGQQAFDGLVGDLMFLPGLRDRLRQDFRNPQRFATLRAEGVSQAIHAFLEQFQQASNRDTQPQ